MNSLSDDFTRVIISSSGCYYLVGEVPLGQDHHTEDCSCDDDYQSEAEDRLMDDARDQLAEID